MASLILWCSIFYLGHHEIANFYEALFGLVIVGAIMGAGLRLMTEAEPQLKMSTVVIDLTCAMILAIGFMLLYFVSAYAIAGGVRQLREVDDFIRTASFLSVLAIAVGYRLERATKEFGDKITRTVFGGLKITQSLH
jgi:hypothetical protein